MGGFRVKKSDIETLTWLKNQIAIDPLDSESLHAFIKQNFEHYIWAINLQGKYLPRLRQQLADKATNDKQKKQALNLTDEQIDDLVAFMEALTSPEFEEAAKAAQSTGGNK